MRDINSIALKFLKNKEPLIAENLCSEFKKVLVFIFLMTFFTGLSFGQTQYNSFDICKIIPTSPEAAMLGRFGDIPIGYYTGTADVSIPIYSVKKQALNCRWFYDITIRV